MNTVLDKEIEIGEVITERHQCPSDTKHTFPDDYKVGDFCRCNEWMIIAITGDSEDHLLCININGEQFYFGS